MRSLRLQLVVFGGFLAAVTLFLALVVHGLWQTSPGVLLEAARGRVEQACLQVTGRYAQSLPAGGEPRVDLVRVLLQLVLAEAPQVEGGLWREGQGMVAYAYPTYEGGGSKTDVPAAESAMLDQLAARAAAGGRPAVDSVRGSRELVVAAACPLPAPAPAAVWTMTRTQLSPLAAEGRVRTAFVVLALAVLGSGAWLALFFHRGLAKAQRLEQALHGASDGELPDLPPTGVTELDRLAASFRAFQQRLQEARAAAREASARQSRDLRLAALGRMSSAVAHEIRNPIGAIRLKAENALAGPPAAHGAALQTIVTQVERLEAVVQSLLALVQPLPLAPAVVDVPAWLRERAAAFAPQARARGITLAVTDGYAGRARFDPLHLARAVDNLVDNAIRHAAPGGRVLLGATVSADRSLLAIAVEDDGPGVPEALRPRLFEPFATGRDDGTGLGLALAREVAIAHGGDLRHEPAAPGARFILEVPWRES